MQRREGKGQFRVMSVAEDLWSSKQKASQFECGISPIDKEYRLLCIPACYLDVIGFLRICYDHSF